MPEIISQAKLRRAIRMQERKIAWMLINTKHATIAERKEQALALEFIQAKLRRAIEVQQAQLRRAIEVQEIAARKEQALALQLVQEREMEFIQAQLRRAIEVQEREIAADRAARQGKGI